MSSTRHPAYTQCIGTHVAKYYTHKFKNQKQTNKTKPKTKPQLYIKWKRFKAKAKMMTITWKKCGQDYKTNVCRKGNKMTQIFFKDVKFWAREIV